MSNQLLHGIEDLIEMNEDELREVMMEDIYDNKQNVKEQFYRLMRRTKEYKEAWEYQKQQNEEYENE